ncbi:unnamed protein product [Phytophthora lilii]|uniref:Unnamed protein product n=1 Tax=Phytophthora lilii TaxID=2077276 RepID=A0A9W6U070_9STRA|nr:unnamed protein product [Phytophthora lilii]
MGTSDEVKSMVLVGDPGVGKTNLLATFLAADAVNEHGVSRSFSAVRKPTIGVEFATAIVRHPNGKRIKAQIWDTGNKQRDQSKTEQDCTDVYMLWDCCVVPSWSRATFNNAQEHWLKELKAAADLSSTLTNCIMLVGNKVDLESPQTIQNPNYVDQEQHESTAVTLGLMHQRTSAKTCFNVRRAFEELVITIYNADKRKVQRAEAVSVIQLDQKVSTSQPSTLKASSNKCC